jgi:hypothetical protein
MFQELSRLFATPLRIKLIKFFALQPGSHFLSHKVASAIGSSRALVQQELRALVRLHIIKTTRVAGGTHFFWNADYEGALGIQNFIIDATTPSDATVLKGFKPLSPYLVVVAGALADETRGVIDLLVVTKRVQDPRIAKVVKKLEIVTAVPIRYAVLEVGEYLARREGFDRMLRDIFDFRHRIITGQS